ncbi:hypothetical protein FJR11_23140 [Anabaena sp. UHCC 0187]|nr:hypothetical protein [Anabaena sp. UHCC 0187]
MGLASISLTPATASATANVAIKSAQNHIASSRVEEFNVVGNEPFWNINVSQKGIVYSWVADKIRKQTFPYVNPQAADGRPLDVLRVYRLRGGADNMLMIQKANGFCSDGMSDKKYPYTATLILGRTVRTGCAEKK